MKNSILILFVIILVGCNSNALPVSIFAGKPLPEFGLQLTDSVTHTTVKDLAGNGPFVLFIFDPDCVHCRGELKSILSDSIIYNNLNLVMVSYAPLRRIGDFSAEFDLEKFRRIKVGRDSSLASLNYFKLSGVPFTAVYDKNHILLQTFDSKVDGKVLYNIQSSKLAKL